MLALNYTNKVFISHLEMQVLLSPGLCYLLYKVVGEIEVHQKQTTLF